MTGFDVIYGIAGVTIDPHVCRRSDGCAGGVTLDEACELVAQWYDEQANLWRSKQHPDCQYFIAAVVNTSYE